MGIPSIGQRSDAHKIVTLWTVFLLGTLFHTQLALMPLFHGMDVVESHAHDFVSVDAIFWFMFGFFLIPLVVLVALLFKPSRQLRRFHFGLTLIYTLLNAVHFLVDMMIAAPGYQQLLMAFLLIVGLLLNKVAHQWMRDFTALRHGM